MIWQLAGGALLAATAVAGVQTYRLDRATTAHAERVTQYELKVAQLTGQLQTCRNRVNNLLTAGDVDAGLPTDLRDVDPSRWLLPE